MTDIIKRTLQTKHRFYRKAQILFFIIIFVCVMLLIFFSTITLFTAVLLSFILLSVILLSGIIYKEAKQNQELIEEYMLFYGMNKIKHQNDKVKSEQKKTQ